MPTKVLREVDQYQLIEGFGAGFNIFDTESEISTNWDDSDFRDLMLSLDDDSFFEQCAEMMESELENYVSCESCGELTDDPTIHHDESFCSYDCAEASCFNGNNPSAHRSLPYA